MHPNGLAFSPDERTMYVSDTSIARVDGGNHHILAFDVVDGRRLDAPRVFLDMEPGVSDGFRVDVDGNVWTSAGDGIHVLDADGRRTRPDHPAPGSQQLPVRRAGRPAAVHHRDLDPVVAAGRDPRGGHALGGLTG